jgi:hypothetical protein
MDLDGFWELIDRSRRGRERDWEAQADELEALLKALPPSEVTTFAAIFAAQEQRAFRCDVHEAGAILDGGLGDDSFKDFRSWLISRGREAFESVLADPDALADLPEVMATEHHTAETFGGVALGAWYDLHDDDPDDAAYAEFSAIEKAHLTSEEREPGPRGQVMEWDDVPRRFARLWALVGHHYRA